MGYAVDMAVKERNRADQAVLTIPLRDSHNTPETKRAFRDTVAVLEDLTDRFGPRVLKSVSETLRTVLRPHEVAPNPETLPPDVRSFTEAEAIELELWALTSAFEQRRRLRSESLTVAQVAKLLGVKSRQTVHDRLHAGSLLGIEDNGVWLFPRWQFDPSGPHGVVAGLPEVLRTLDTVPISKASWLTLPNRELDGRTPLQALKDGNREYVVALARGVDNL